MKSFKNYISESRMTTVGEITAAIAGHKKAGEILNPTYQDLGSQARRIFGSDTRHVQELMLKHFHAGDKTPELNDLYYSWPSDSFASLNKAAKLLAKVKNPKHKDVVTAGNEVVKKWIPIATDLKDLKGKVVKITQKRAEAKVVAASNMSRKFADSSSLIKIFESHMQEYIDMAKKRSEEFIKAKLDILKKHDMNLDKVAPRPNSRTMGASEYKSAQAKRDLYRSFVKPVSDTHRSGDPYIVKANQVLIDRYIELNVKGAEDAYRKFMGKMIEKIGKPVVDAKMTGNIWTNATLHVTTDDGEEQVWSTQMIINFSKYQTMFNQFPSRRKK
jgi:hypothetical protein